MKLEQVHQFMKEHFNEKAKASWEKFAPTAEDVWGVYLTDINPLVKELRPWVKENQNATLNLVRELWKGKIEEQILASKLLVFVDDFDIKEFTAGIHDWAVCDTLAMQGFRKFAKKQPRHILDLSKELAKSEDFWVRRFALAILVNLAKQPEHKDEIKEIVESLADDKEYYVKKAVVWLRKELKK